MDSVLFSIQPEPCSFIAQGIKEWEFRTKPPKIKPPYKGYIYCTSPKRFVKGFPLDDLFRHKDGRIEYGFSYQLACEADEGESLVGNILSRKVIGEFICDEVIEVVYHSFVNPFAIAREVLQKGHLSNSAFLAYTNNYRKDLYALHISDLKIYDKPKELGEFYAPCPAKFADKYDCSDDNKSCKYFTEDEEGFFGCCREGITRPPQSWCYVEEV